MALALLMDRVTLFPELDRPCSMPHLSLSTANVSGTRESGTLLSDSARRRWHTGNVSSANVSKLNASKWSANASITLFKATRAQFPSTNPLLRRYKTPFMARMAFSLISEATLRVLLKAMCNLPDQPACLLKCSTVKVPLAHTCNIPVLHL